ncbi:MAG: murein transglycosylase A [Betaproteobacteria bacterium]
MTHIRTALILLAAVAMLGGCVTCPECPAPAKPPVARPAAQYTPASFEALPGWQAARLEPSLRAFLAGCPRPALARACELGAAVPADDEPAARRFFEESFVPYAISSENGDSGLITGYYEPVLAASRLRSDEYRHAIYGVPQDLVVVDLASVTPETRHLRLRGRLDGRRLVPYFSRAEIEARAPPAPVIAWAADAVEVFFLQIQGSGQLELADGGRVRVGYADQNGHPYRSLGRHLIDRGELSLEQASMQGIKAWAAANPHKLQEALNANASYVFFRELEARGGPLGALGVPLTAQYSLAVDRRYVPLGAPVYLATTFPASDAPLERLMAAQDTGGAIRGAVRADFYWGSGAHAGAQAGRMRQQGRLWLLWPRGSEPPRPD